MKRIIVDNLSKEFRIGFKKNQTTLARVLSFFSGKEPKKTLRVLKNVSFSVEAGEIIGIIGKNGSGKTTLLRILADIYPRYEGLKTVNGKIVPLIWLGAGLNPRLTMAESIFLIGSFFKLSQRAIKERFHSIVKFSGLQNFVDTKVYQFSTGMKERLAFSTATHCDPEILLLDEAFAVGDEDFRRKTAEKIKELVRNKVAVVLVSHELRMIEEYCDRVLWMDRGRIIKDGSAKDILKEYTKG